MKANEASVSGNEHAHMISFKRPYDTSVPHCL
jgi:hypothetical protein